MDRNGGWFMIGFTSVYHLTAQFWKIEIETHQVDLVQCCWFSCFSQCAVHHRVRADTVIGLMFALIWRAAFKDSPLKLKNNPGLKFKTTY